MRFRNHFEALGFNLALHVTVGTYKASLLVNYQLTFSK